MLQRAKKRAKEIGKLNGSITGGKGNKAGCIGEEIVLKLIPDFTLENTYDYDLIAEETTVDVKTKRCTSVPRRHYECSVSDFNTEQKTTIYAFTRIFEEYGYIRSGWFLGWLLKEEFYKRAVFHKKGELDSSNNFTFKDDCYNVPIYCLRSLDHLKEYVIISSLEQYL